MGGGILFYLNFVRLCNSIGKSPSAVAEEMGFQRSVVTRWSNGSVPRKATLEKIASYFGVNSSDLTGEAQEQKEKPSTPEGDGLKDYFDELYDQMTMQQRKEMIEYMEFKVSKQEGGSNG